MNAEHKQAVHFAPDDDVNVVVLRNTGGQYPVTLEGTAVDLGEDADLDDALLDALLNSTVALHCPTDITPEAAAALTDARVPERFARSGWLHEHHPLVLDLHDQHATAEFLFTYHPTYGLRITDGLEEEQ